MAADTSVTCLYCDSTAVERLALFGGQLMTSQYRCRACGSIFEQIRWGAPLEEPWAPASPPAAEDTPATADD